MHRLHFTQSVHWLGSFVPASLAYATADTESSALVPPHPTHPAPPSASGVLSGVSIRNSGQSFSVHLLRRRVAAKLVSNDYGLINPNPIPASFCSDMCPSD